MTDYTQQGAEAPSSGSGLSRAENWAAFLALFCFAVVIFFAKASESTIPATDAATHAELAMSATASGLIPKLPLAQAVDLGSWGKGFNDHPFTFFYLSGWIMRLFGPDSWSAKLLSCLFSVGTVMLTFSLGRVLRSTVLGLLAGIILCLSRDFMTDGLNAHLDNVMLFFILASFIFWEKGRPLLAGVAVGLGLWFKSPVAFMLYPALIIVHLFRFDLLPRLKPFFLSLLVALAVGSGIWIMTGLIGGWDLVNDYWVRQLWGTAVGGRGGEIFDPLVFLGVLRSHYMPWTILFLVGIVWNVALFRFRRAEFLVPAAAAVVVIGVISCIRFKYAHYFVPAYPFMALIAAQPLAFWFERRARGLIAGFTVFTMLGATVILATPVNPSPESFPSLRKFMSYMQASGDCHDQVVMVEGGQPYGTYLDYSNLIHFYTGRQTLKAGCQTVNLAAEQKSVKWILIAGTNATNCLDDSVRRAFPVELVDGDQRMLARSQMVPSLGNGKLDLTPLNRDLKAVQDCKAAPLVNDRYHSYKKD